MTALHAQQGVAFTSVGITHAEGRRPSMGPVRNAADASEKHDMTFMVAHTASLPDQQ